MHVNETKINFRFIILPQIIPTSLASYLFQKTSYCCHFPCLKTQFRHFYVVSSFAFLCVIIFSSGQETSASENLFVATTKRVLFFVIVLCYYRHFPAFFVFRIAFGVEFCCVFPSADGRQMSKNGDWPPFLS